MEIARLSGEAQVRNVMALWDDLPEYARERVRIEDLLGQIGMAPEDFLAELVRAGHKAGVQQASLVLGLASPLVAEAAVHAALRPDGHRDRRLIFQSGGLLPQPKGSFTAIGRNIQVNIPQSAGLPRLEDDNIIDVGQGLPSKPE